MPPADHSFAVTLRSDGPACTELIGSVMGTLAAPGDLLLLYGELGAGKTRLAQGVLKGLGSCDYVRSPTFVLIMEHQARLPMYHVDLYRLQHGSDLDSIGLEEYVVGQGVCLVEWADRAPKAFPSDRLEVMIRRDDISDHGRTLALGASGARHRKLLAGVADELASLAVSEP